jgi:hypothetical protein
VELCLYLLYALAEYVGQITRSLSSADAEGVLSTYQHLVQSVLRHNVVAYPNVAVVTQVFEGMRACAMLKPLHQSPLSPVLGRNPKHLASDDCAVPLLQAFLGPSGVLSDTPKIRSRCVLFVSSYCYGLC